MDPMGYQMVKLLGFWSVSISSSTIPGAYIEEYQWKIDKLPRLPWLYRGENWCFVFLNLQIIWNKCDYMTSGYILALVISRNTVPLFLCRTMKRHRFHLTVACLYIYIPHTSYLLIYIISLYFEYTFHRYQMLGFWKESTMPCRFFSCLIQSLIIPTRKRKKRHGAMLQRWILITWLALCTDATQGHETAQKVTSPKRWMMICKECCLN